MQVGDPRKAGALAAVAVMVVGVAVFRAVPKGDPSGMKVLGSGAGPSNAAPAKPETLPESLATDPFSHPVLAKRDTKGDAVRVESGPSPRNGGKVKPFFPQPGNIDGALTGELPSANEGSPSGSKPTGITGIDRSDEKGVLPPLKVSVEAVMGGETKMAYVIIAGEERTVKAGDHLRGILKISDVRLDSVAFRFAKKTVIVHVGEEKSL